MRGDEQASEQGEPVETNDDKDSALPSTKLAKSSLPGRGDESAKNETSEAVLSVAVLSRSMSSSPDKSFNSWIKLLLFRTADSNNSLQVGEEVDPPNVPTSLSLAKLSYAKLARSIEGTVHLGVPMLACCAANCAALDLRGADTSGIAAS